MKLPLSPPLPPADRTPLDALAEPVRRYLRHALPDPAATGPSDLLLQMSGRIRVGLFRLSSTSDDRHGGRAHVPR